MSTWKLPHAIKIYEALGAVADNRITESEDKFVVQSSSKKKEYWVYFDFDKRQIIANDNGSYWQGYMGYPAIAVLIASGFISVDKSILNNLKGVDWGYLNQEHKRNYDRVINYVLGQLDSNVADMIRVEVESVSKQLEEQQWQKHFKRVLPPK